MKIVFCWPTISGYMAACWQALARRPAVDLFVVGMRQATGEYSDFEPSVMEGVPCHLLDDKERWSYGRIRELVRAQEPDVLFVSGWQHRPYVRLAFDRSFKDGRRFMMIDTPLRANMKQRVGKMILWPYLARMEGVFVPGERSWQYARWLGVPESRIHRGTYGVDWAGLSALWARRRGAPDGWPRSFLFAGQYIHRKGVDVLAEAYAVYRGRVADPWPLVACGRGPERAILRKQPGITDRGFLQPDAMAEVRARSGVFVLPSRSDAWPLALVEACAAGLPVVCSDACGSAVELVRSHHNGLVIPTGEAGPLADALEWMHGRYDRLHDMGRASTDMAAAYAAERWADRVLDACAGRTGS